MTTEIRKRVSAELVMHLIVRDNDAIDRVTGPNGDEWRSRFYPLFTENDVIKHWAFNLLWNGVENVNRLEGWADLSDDAVVVGIQDVVDLDVNGEYE